MKLVHLYIRQELVDLNNNQCKRNSWYPQIPKFLKCLSSSFFSFSPPSFSCFHIHDLKPENILIPLKLRWFHAISSYIHNIWKTSHWSLNWLSQLVWNNNEKSDYSLPVADLVIWFVTVGIDLLTSICLSLTRSPGLQIPSWSKILCRHAMSPVSESLPGPEKTKHRIKKHFMWILVIPKHILEEDINNWWIFKIVQNTKLYLH